MPRISSRAISRKPNTNYKDGEGSRESADSHAAYKHDAREISAKEVERIKAEYGLAESIVRKCHNAFLMFDSDGSGVMEMAEIKAMLVHLEHDVSETEFAHILVNQDKDGSGTLDFEEFLHLFSSTSSVKNSSLEQKIDSLAKNVRAQMHSKRRSPVQRANEDGIPETVLKRFLRKEIAEADACMQLPTAVLLFSVFFAAVATHEQIWLHYCVDLAVGFDIEENANFAFSGILPFENGRMGFKSVNDVNNVPDFWSWLSLGLIPLLWPETWDVSESRANILGLCTSPASAFVGSGWRSPWAHNLSQASVFNSSNCPEQDPAGLPEEFYGEHPGNLYLYYNRLLGGLRMRQERRDPEECAGPKSVSEASFAAPCYSGDYWLLPEMHDSIQSDLSIMDHPDAPKKLLRTGLARADILQQLRQLEKGRWLSPAAQKIEVSFVVYNANVDMITLTYINFFFTHSGNIWKMIEPDTIPLTMYSKWQSYVFDSMFALMTFRIFFAESLDVLQYVRQLGFVKGVKQYAAFWNLVDWASCLYAMFIMVLWWMMIQRTANLVEIMKSADRSIPGEWEREEDILKFMTTCDEIVRFQLMFRKVLAVYPFLIAARFFKSFAAQPRLSVVVKTLEAAAQDIFHFGIVFVCVFMVYALSAMELFGQELRNFTQVNRAMNTLWRILQGDIEWDDMNDIGRLEAGLWFWSFSMLVFLVMLNMLVALVMDVYTSVKCSIGEAETLVSQTQEIIRRHKAVRAGKALSLDDVLNSLDDTPLGDDGDDDGTEVNITVVGLVERVPRLPIQQAEDLLVGACAFEEEEMREDCGLSEAMQKIAVLNTKGISIQKSMEQLFYLCEMMSELIGPQTQVPERAESSTSMEDGDAPPKPASAELEECKGAQVLNGSGQENGESTVDKLIKEACGGIKGTLTAETIAAEMLNGAVDKSLSKSVKQPLAILAHRYGEVFLKLEELERISGQKVNSISRQLDDAFGLLARERIRRHQLPVRGIPSGRYDDAEIHQVNAFGICKACGKPAGSCDGVHKGGIQSVRTTARSYR